jgi:hypothetical protein
MVALLLSTEQGEITFQESRDVVTASPDIVGRDLGVLEQCLGLGIIEQRHRKPPSGRIQANRHNPDKQQSLAESVTGELPRVLEPV